MDRTRVELPCPGSRNNYKVIVNTAELAQWGVGHPANRGNCPLFLGGLDSSGKPISPENDLQIHPGFRVDWYHPPSGTAQIVAVCTEFCTEQTDAVAVLEYDTPVC